MSFSSTFHLKFIIIYETLMRKGCLFGDSTGNSSTYLCVELRLSTWLLVMEPGFSEGMGSLICHFGHFSCKLHDIEKYILDRKGSPMQRWPSEKEVLLTRDSTTKCAWSTSRHSSGMRTTPLVDRIAACTTQRVLIPTCTGWGLSTQEVVCPRGWLTDRYKNISLPQLRCSCSSSYSNRMLQDFCSDTESFKVEQMKASFKKQLLRKKQGRRLKVLIEMYVFLLYSLSRKVTVTKKFLKGKLGLLCN